MLCLKKPYCEDDPAATSPLLIYDGEEMRDFGEHKVSVRNRRDGFCQRGL